MIFKEFQKKAREKSVSDLNAPEHFPSGAPPPFETGEIPTGGERKDRTGAA